MTYNAETELLMQECKENGLNIWAMLHIFKRRSKLSPEIPDEVIQEVCKEYMNRKGQIRADFPYFLMVLKRKTSDYFARQRIQEHEAIKKEPVKMNDLFKRLATQ